MRLPTGPAVAFLFTDIEGSTRLERAVGSERWAQIVGRHDGILRSAIERNGGIVVKSEGDAFFASFALPIEAMRAAIAGQRALAVERWTDAAGPAELPDGFAIRVRMGVHLGEGRLRAPTADEVSGRREDQPQDYVGIDVNYAARITAAGNGGQIVLSAALVQALPGDIGGAHADDAALAGTRLVAEGPRIVKDFDEPLPLWRLVVEGAAEDDRPLRTAGSPGNLPAELTPLVGRDAQVEATMADLAVHRLVTLTGPGGTGKTRLAIAVAEALRPRFPGGSWFVDLAAVRHASLIAPAIAATLGVRESADVPIDDALRDHLRDRSLLLLLDNLEQLLPDGASIVARLLRDTPGLRILATSRELLRVSGELGSAVPPLDLGAGVALFVDRARVHRPALALRDEEAATVRRICERLGGLPLAIELAAARARLLSPAQILDRLGKSLDLGGGARDLPERQRTLRGTVAWSYDLLTEPERRLFTRLAVFASSWTPETAALVVDAGGDLGIDLFEGIESLVDKSLVRLEAGNDTPDEGGDGDGTAAPPADLRFNLHSLLREYADERLEERGERARTEARFVDACADLAEDLGRAILGEGGEKVLARLDREDPNLRAAIDWAAANGRPDLALRIVAATWRWFQQRGRLREGRALLGETLAAVGPVAVDARVRVAALAAEGGLAYWMNDIAGAKSAYEQRLALAAEIGDPLLRADAHYDLGFVFMVGGQGDELREHERQALELYTAAGEVEGQVRARQALVLSLFLAADYASALELEVRNLDAFRVRRSQVQIADSLTLLTAIEWRIGDPEAAWSRLSEGLALWRTIDSSAGLARALGMAAIIQLADGDPELGARIAGAVYGLVRDKGVMLAPVTVLHLPDPAALVAERLPAERGAQLLAEGDAIAVDEVVDLVLATPAPQAAGLAAARSDPHG